MAGLNSNSKIDHRIGFDRSKNILGRKFGRWTVLDRAGTSKHRMALWKCRCDCGSVDALVTGTLTSGKSKSCGCLHREQVTTHGLSKTPVYRSWRAMMARCYSPTNNRFDSYAERGIQVCKRWRDFESFVEDMGHPPGSRYSIERIDNDGDYDIENCRWALPKEQARNRRSTLWIEFQGETKSLAEWAEILGLNYKNTWKRLRNKRWSVERAFEVTQEG